MRHIKVPCRCSSSPDRAPLNTVVNTFVRNHTHQRLAILQQFQTMLLEAFLHVQVILVTIKQGQPEILYVQCVCNFQHEGHVRLCATGMHGFGQPYV